MGGVWQALAFGFLGMAAKRGTLLIRPNLPSAWSALGLRLRFAGQSIAVRAETDHVAVTCVAPLVVDVNDQGPAWCAPGTTAIALDEPFSTKERR